MNPCLRNGFKWSINEILSLQREFELLCLDINKIAQKHQRTPNSIMHKLHEEGFADYNVLYNKLNASLAFVNEHENVDKLDTLSGRVDGIEEGISEIKSIIKQMVTNINTSLTESVI
jgi:hypothetical protein